ncbi:LAGLIDADG family homing endonuclease, partial [Actinomadura kijaniata]|uniref:Hint domain-containing protein n=1 Tax=Actinomadura kijaniata TaxID=46161 RepID=UPI003F1E29B7
MEQRFCGSVCRITTVYGRSITVTGDQLFFTYSHGRTRARPARDVQVGDLLVMGRCLPRPERCVTEIDLARVLRDAGQAAAVRVEGEAVRRLMAEKAATRQPAVLRRNEDRVRLPRDEWKRLASIRKARRITGADMAVRIGYRQACSISEFETCRSLPPVEAFQCYLDQLGEPWPPLAEIVPSLVRQWSETESANERYRTASTATWLAELTEEDMEWLDAQQDGRDLVLYPRAHRGQAVGRMLPVTEDLCYMLGWYLAEGSLSSRDSRLNFSLGAGDDRYLPELRDVLRKVVGAEPVVAHPKGRPNSRHLYVHAPLHARLIKAIGLGRTARFKRIPELVFNLPEAEQFVFLEGYYLGDGTKEKTGRTLAFATSSRQLASDLLYLLGQLGVTAGVNGTPGGTSFIRGHAVHRKPGYTVFVRSKLGLRRLEPLWRKAPSAPAYRSRAFKGWAKHGFETSMSETLMALPVR